MAFNLNNLVRKNILQLKPYSSARNEFQGKASVFLDANENGYGSPLEEDFNRYPDPLQWQLKFQLAKIKGVPAENIFIGNGSDEVIDLAFRIFCEPEKDNVIICSPTYGMYEVSANINNVTIQNLPLTADFELDILAVLKAINPNTKLIFICSPNNPTGNSMNAKDIERIIEGFDGIVLIDEAYINFSSQPSFIQGLTKYPNLIVMQTLSKAWGLAALRVGIGFAALDIIDIFNKVKPPYNINEASQQLALEALSKTSMVNNWIKEIVDEREKLKSELDNLSFVKNIFPSEANFLLIQVNDALSVYNYLAKNEIVIRNRSSELNCENCLRISIGKPSENKKLIEVLKSFSA